MSDLARCATLSAQARPDDRFGPARAQFTSYQAKCRTKLVSGFGPPDTPGPPPLRLGTRNRATPWHMRHTAVHQSRSPLSLSALAPAGTKATCRRALHRRRHHLVPAQVTCCRCHAIKREEGPVAAAISADRVALLAHLAGPLDASLHPCSLPTPKQVPPLLPTSTTTSMVSIQQGRARYRPTGPRSAGKRSPYTHLSSSPPPSRFSRRGPRS